MKDFYITLGQDHTHRFGNTTLDKDIVIVLKAKDHEEGSRKAFELFGRKWSMIYEEKPKMKYFPRGLYYV